MPELPDVEILKRYCDSTCLHQTIEAVDVYSSRVIKTGDLQSELRGHSFEATARHGKYLFLHLDNDKWMVMHFGMTGDLKYFKLADQKPEYTQVLFCFDNDYRLAYRMPRKLGEIRIVADKADFIEEKALGPDVMDDDLDFQAFKELLSKRRGIAKSTLMNQKIMAGIGNVYSDEILFQAGVHPRKKINELDEDDLHELYSAMRRVLQTAIDHDANPQELPEGYLIPHRSEEEECPRCGGKVERIEVSGRGGYFCPQCQNI